MSEVGSGEVAIFPTFQGFRSSVVSEVDSSGKESGSIFASAFKKTMGVLAIGVGIGVGAAATGIGAIISAGFNRSLNIQDAKEKLLGLGHSAEAVTEIMKNATASVKGTAFNLGDAAGVAASAVAAGIAPGEALTRTLTATANAAAIAGVPLNEMGSIINKVATNGALTTDVLQQFQDRGVPLLQTVADQYGVTNEAAQKMVTDGKVSFADFQSALEKSVGSGATAAGNAARGAFGNLQTAFARLGAMFTDPLVAAAPGVFDSIGGAVDRLSVTLQPLADKFTAWLIPAVAQFTTFVDGIDFGVIATRIQGLFDGITNSVSGAQSTVAGTDIGSSLGTILDVARPLAPIAVAVAKGIGEMAGPVGDLISSGIALLPPIISVFAGALGFLRDNSGLVLPLIIGIAAAMAIYQASVIAANIASLAMIPAYSARTVAMVAGTLATIANTAATGGNAAVTTLNTAAVEGGLIGLLAQKVALGAGAAATGVATAAQWLFNAALDANPIGIIILAVAALIAGLIYFFTQTELGQEIWANFTKFLGEAWANIVAVAQVVFGALGDFFATIWNVIVSVVTTYIMIVQTIITTVVQIISVIWNALWQGISNYVGFVWSLIVFIVTTYINLLVRIISAVVGFIIAVWQTSWQLISDVITNVWSFIVGFVTTYINTVSDVIANVIGFVVGVWQAGWDLIGQVVSTVWNAISTFISGAVNGVAGAISGFVSNVSNGVQSVFGFISGLPDKVLGVLGNLGNLLVSSGRSLIQGFIDGIRGMLGAVGDAVGGVMNFVGSFFPHSPAERGQFSGSGWTAVKTAGLAIGGQLQSGLEASKSGVQTAVDGLMNLGAVTTGAVATSATADPGAGRASGIKSITFGNGVALVAQMIEVAIENYDGTTERMMVSGSVS